jgi:uncharacterized protein YbbC (DUF1343 family)
MLRLVIVVVSLLGAFVAVAQPEPKVKLGIDVLEASGFDALQGKRVGLVVHPASVNGRLQRTLDVLRNAPGVKLVALFGPEHGVYGDVYAGDKIDDGIDARTGLPAYSLYGKTRKPTTEMLADIDVMVFDLQDIGARSYTFISTMKVVMQACAEQGKELVVLDRPNPLGGRRVEGPGLQKEFESFVGLLYVPYVHGMTMGELAKFVQATELPNYKQLTVIPMQGWERNMLWPETGLAWVPTSPHIPNFEAAVGYSAVGFIGELLVISNGVGTTQPFQIIGAPWINGDALAEALNTAYTSPRGKYEAIKAGRNQPSIQTSAEGIYFRPIRFRPFFATFKEQVCQGVQLHIDPATADNLVEINFRVLQAVGADRLFAEATAARHSMFDKVSGSAEPRQVLSNAQDPSTMFQKWREECAAFIKAREAYLLYP